MLATVTWILFASMKKEMDKWGSRFVGTQSPIHNISQKTY